MTNPPETDRRYAGFEIDESYDRFHKRKQRVGWLNYDGGMWLVSAHEDVTRVLKDDVSFSSAHDLPNGCTAFKGAIAPPTSLRVIPLEMDPPGYRNYRRIIAPLLSPSAIRSHIPMITENTTWCLDQSIETGAMDLYSDLILLAPAMVLLSLLGLPVEDARILADAVHAQVDDGFDKHPGWQHIASRIKEAVGKRRTHPRTDVITRLMNDDADGWRIPDEDLLEVCFALVLGGMATTTKFALGVFSYFGVHTAQRKRIAEPGYLANALEEFLRYYSPLPFLCRTATRDVTVGGQHIRQGERIAVSFAAANHDPNVFPGASDIDTSRLGSKHLAFGLGLHFCPGSALARAELTVMVSEVLRRMPDYAIANSGYLPPDPSERRGPRLSWRDRMDRGLRVTFTPGTRAGDGRTLSFTKLARADPGPELPGSPAGPR
jgi:cytochrome P450